MNSALYVGHVRHQRLRPRPHHLRYRFFWMRLDLDELPALARRLRLFSLGKFNLFSFDEGDHLGPGGNLAAQVRELLEKAGIEAAGRIEIMCLPRILGHVFNPVSLIFCHAGNGALKAIIYEVNNTFGQRHSYLFHADGAPVIAHGCDKEFYVSPFMPMQMRYQFRSILPGADHNLTITGDDENGPLIVANFVSRREELSDNRLLARFLTHPLLSVMVVVGIHFEALKLWLKGISLVRRPEPPKESVTIVTNS